MERHRVGTRLPRRAFAVQQEQVFPQEVDAKHRGDGGFTLHVRDPGEPRFARGARHRIVAGRDRRSPLPRQRGFGSRPRLVGGGRVAQRALDLPIDLGLARFQIAANSRDVVRVEREVVARGRELAHGEVAHGGGRAAFLARVAHRQIEQLAGCVVDARAQARAVARPDELRKARIFRSAFCALGRESRGRLAQLGLVRELA